MAVPTLTPKSQTSIVALPITGAFSTAAEASSYAFAIYASVSSPLYDTNFISGAVDQISYTYKKLGGDVLDIELKETNVYTAFEEAVLEYSYILNIHQGKNILTNVLGDTTGTFDHQGELLSGSALSSSLSGTSVALKYPRFDYTYTKTISNAVSTDSNVGGDQSIYSASFHTKKDQQDYDLQQIVHSASINDPKSSFYRKVGNNRVTIRKVFYKTPHAMWRFYGYYGGINTVGNLSSYGMYADDSTFEIIPVWQNKMQAMAYEDAIYTRNSHYAYEVKNNHLRLFPAPPEAIPTEFWFEFTVDRDAWEQVSGSTGKNREIEGINNLNTLPFGNLPYKNINSIGKQWIRRFALSLTKEMLGQVRGKFTTVPIPGESVTLNHSELLSQAKEEQEKLREELKTILDELTYAKLAEKEAAMMTQAGEALSKVPVGVMVG